MNKAESVPARVCVLVCARVCVYPKTYALIHTHTNKKKVGWRKVVVTKSRGEEKSWWPNIAVVTKSRGGETSFGRKSQVTKSQRTIWSTRVWVFYFSKLFWPINPLQTHTKRHSHTIRADWPDLTSISIYRQVFDKKFGICLIKKQYFLFLNENV